MSDRPPGAFPRSEFVARLAALWGEMRRRRIEVMLLDDIEIVAYFTGFEVSLNRYRACLVPLDTTPITVLRELDLGPFRERSPFGDCVGFADTDDPVAAVAAVLASRGLARAVIGIDFASHALTLESFRTLQEALPEAQFVAVTHLPWELRLVKSEAEIARLNAAAGIADQTMREIIAMLRPGMTPRNVTMLAARCFMELGGDPEYVGRIAIGNGWDFLHNQQPDQRLSEGDVLHVELAPSYGGYSARLMRSVVIGPIDERRSGVAERLVALQDGQIAAMRPGILASAVDGILRQGVLEAGLRDSYANITGYTLGYYSRQPVRSSDFTRVFAPTSDWRLESDMVFHMYTSAQGISFSETVVVRGEGGERLTRLERRLFSVPPA